MKYVENYRNSSFKGSKELGILLLLFLRIFLRLISSVKCSLGFWTKKNWGQFLFLCLSLEQKGLKILWETLNTQKELLFMLCMLLCILGVSGDLYITFLSYADCFKRSV